MFRRKSASVEKKYNLISSLTYMASSDFDCIENYDVSRLIGRGGFGNVYQANSIRHNEEVAIKFIDKKIIQSRPGCLKRVLQEVAIHSDLEHPSIIKVFSFFEDSDYIYLVLELCPLGDLNSRLKNYPQGFDENQVHGYMCQIIEGILYLQKRRILHRDLTLSNMLLTQEDTVKIADFGLATQLSDANEKHFTMCGTPNYISPEVINQEAHGLESDLWSVGCMLYAMLTGRPPFEADEIKDTLDRVRSGKYVVPTNLSIEAKSLIGMLLQKNPNDRLKLQNIFRHPFFVKHESQVDSYSRELSVDSGRDTMHGSSLNNSAGSQTAFKFEDLPLQKVNPPFYHQKTLGDLPNQLYRTSELNKYIGNYDNIVAPLNTKAFNSSISSAFLANTSFLSQSVTSSSSPANLKNDEDDSIISHLSESPRKSFTISKGALMSSKHPNLKSFDERVELSTAVNYQYPCQNAEFHEAYHSPKGVYQQAGKCETGKSSESSILKLREKNMRSRSLGNLKNLHKQNEIRKIWTAVSIDIDSYSQSQKSKKLSVSEFFTTARLRPRRHKLKHAVITISEDGCVFAEFFKLQGFKEEVYKLMKISPNGKEIYVEEIKDGRETSYNTSHLPSIHGDSKIYKPDTIPQGTRKELEYVSRFIHFVRSDTPKITLYTNRAKCMLMENLPIPDFKAEFYSGCKFLMTTEVTKIFQPDGTFVTLNPRGSFTHLSPEMQKMCNHAQETHIKCQELESLLSQSAKDPDDPIFPVTFGIKSYLGDPSSPGSNMSSYSTNSSELSTSKSKRTSSPSDSMSLSHHMRRSTSLHSDIPCSPCPTTENLNEIAPPHFEGPTNDALRGCLSPRKESLQPQRAKSLTSLSKNRNFNSISFRKCVSIPGVLVAFELPNSVIVIKNVDGSEVIVDTQSFEITFPNKTKERLPLQDNIQIPPHIVEKIKDLPMVISMLERASYLSEEGSVG